jgi:hypothetical protein
MWLVFARVVQQQPTTTTTFPGVRVSPSAEGMPGAELVQQLLNWAQMAALWASLAALLGGAAMYGLAREGGSYGAATRGKGLALAGAVGAILAGLAPTAVNMLFEAAQR